MRQMTVSYPDAYPKQEARDERPGEQSAALLAVRTPALRPATGLAKGPAAWARALRRRIQAWGGRPSGRSDESVPSVPVRAQPGWNFAPDDPLVAYLEERPWPARLARLTLGSPLLDQLRAGGVEVAAPLLNNGVLVGVLALGPRKSDQEYTSADRRLLGTLADQVAPALHVAQLVEEQQEQAVAAERIAQEMRMAHEIQLSLLPKTLPHPAGWALETKYQPARAVGGDFFDFVEIDEHRFGVLMGDVTGKGMPAALIMATTKAVLRSVADTGARPSDVLQRANNLLVRDMPPGYFVTCLYAVIDTRTGATRFANAGHNPPFLRHAGRVSKLDAVGMPLGLMPDMEYDEGEVTVAPGGCVLFYSDGVTEAHNPERRMFGFDGLQALLERISTAVDPAAEPDLCPTVLEGLLAAVQAFTGEQAEQEDDITLLALHRLPA